MSDDQRTTFDLLAELRRVRSKRSRVHMLWLATGLEPFMSAELAACDTHIRELKAVLATREHLPRRWERVQARRVAALLNRGQGKSRNR